MKNNDPGYPLPDGDAYTDDLACSLVFWPNKPEYRRALRAALDYMATWTAWQRDDDKRGKDAALAWKLANEQTMECLEMGICDTLISTLESIRINSGSCFCEYIELDPVEPPHPDVTPMQGTPPSEWGDGNVITTWDDWRTFVCNAADEYVNFMSEQADQLADLMTAGAIAIGLIAGILGIMSGAGILIAIGYGTAAGIFTGLVGAGAGISFDNVSDEIEDARADIIEVLSCGGDLGAVMQGAINATAWNLFYQFVDWNAATAVIQSGEYGGEFLPVTIGVECPQCTEIGWTITHDFAVDREGWGTAGGVGWHSGLQALYFNSCQATEFTNLDYTTIKTQAGHPDADAMQIDSIQVEWKNINNTAAIVAVEIRLAHAIQGNIDRQEALVGANGTIVQYEEFPDSPATGTSIRLQVYDPGTCTGDTTADNVIITGRAIYS